MRNSRERTSKKRVAAIAVITLILVGGGGTATYAFWTSTGAGNGTAATGTTSAVVVNQAVASTPLTPGGATQALSGTFDNTANSSPVTVSTVTATITGNSKSGTGCLTSDYVLSNGGVATTPSVGTPVSVPVGSGVGAWSGLTLSMTNTALNQDACKGAVVSISYVAN